MKIFTNFLVTLFFTSTALAQSPVLVQDYTVGETGSFSASSAAGKTSDGRIVFPIIDENLGRELAVLDNGELSLLMDINEGAESSSPSNFISWNGQVYFAAFDAENGGAIWRTDGTIENTERVPGHGLGLAGKPRGVTLAASGYLYYTYENILYRTDGIGTDSIFSGVDFTVASEQRSRLYTKYKDEVAFLTVIDDTLKLYTVENGSAILLAETAKLSRFADIYGLSEVSQGLMFGIDEGSLFPENTGTFVYNSTDQSLEEISIAGDYARRLHPYTQEAALAWVGGKGYYASNGVDGEEERLFGASNQSFTQGEPVRHGKDQDKMVFLAKKSFFENFLYYTDGTAAGSFELVDVDFISNILISDGHAFVADGISNGFQPNLFYIKMVDGSFNNFYSFTEDSNNGSSVLPIGYQNDKLYFLSNLDPAVGRELYSIEVDITTAIDEIEKPDFDVVITSSGYIVNTDIYSDVRVQVYTIDGKLIDSHIRATNVYHDLSNLYGMYILEIRSERARSSHKFLGIKK